MAAQRADAAPGAQATKKELKDAEKQDRGNDRPQVVRKKMLRQRVPPRE